MKPSFQLTAEDARTAAAASLAEARAMKLSISIAIVDTSGFLVYFERMDGVPPITVEIAMRKARSALLVRASTEQVTEFAKRTPGLLQIPDFIAVGGGYPIVYEGATVGAIAVSGGSGEEDGKIAMAGLNAIGVA